jgi:Asp-tRNA(Asn)/Glu-tRNA(Gln) amidotransferase A subunit family amidase
MGESAPLAYLTAHEQLRLFRTRELSPVEVLYAQIGQIDAVEDQVNALTYRHLDDALAAAAAAERRYARGEALPLDGITVALKDEYHRAGWITEAGSKVFKGSVKERNDPAVDKLLAAGLVLHVQTAVPELYFGGFTWSDLHGVTRNPWNPECTPGGSSGGSAAALAAGMTTLATGSDMGGSIRIPAALCGLYGLKPPYGRVAPADESAFLVQASLGPLARNFLDLVLLHNAMAGPMPGSLPTLRPKLELPLSYPPIEGWPIAFSMDQGWAEIAPDVRENTRTALQLLERCGAIVDEVDLGLDVEDTDLRTITEKAVLSGALGGELAELAPKRHELTTTGRYVVDRATTMGPRDTRAAAEAAVRLYRAVDAAVFQHGYCALVMPTVATTRIAADFDPTRHEITINGRTVDPHVGWLLTSLFNILNFMPVISVPTGLGTNGVPTGMQIAANTYEDIAGATVAAAYAQEAAPLFRGELFPGFSSPQGAHKETTAGRMTQGTPSQ